MTTSPGRYPWRANERHAASIYEGLLVSSDRGAALEQAQRSFLDALTQRARAQVAFRLGSRWATRHQNLETGAKFLEEAFSLDPSLEAAFTFLRDFYGAKEGNWDKVLGLLEHAAENVNKQGNEVSPYLVAQGGFVAWQKLGNLIRASARAAKRLANRHAIGGRAVLTALEFPDDLRDLDLEAHDGAQHRLDVVRGRIAHAPGVLALARIPGRRHIGVGAREDGEHRGAGLERAPERIRARNVTA